MARMHSRSKGQSGSTKPSELEKPSWINYKNKEIEMLVVKFADQGKSPSEIGTLLRDLYGIPSLKKVIGKSVTELLEEKDLLPEIPSDLLSLIKKADDLRNHLEENKNDNTAKRGLQLTESKIRRLAKYYVREGRLPSDWRYDPEKAKLYV